MILSASLGMTAQRESPATTGKNGIYPLTRFLKQILAAIALGVLFWIGPGIKGALQQSREAENKDWAGALLPIIIVVIFVFFLIKMV